MNLLASVAALGCVLAAAPPVDQPPAPVGERPRKNEVKFADRQPATPQFGKVRAEGTFAVTGDWTVVSITLRCSPSRGGELLSKKAELRNDTWSAEIAPVPAGTYNVRADMVLKNRTSKEEITVGSAFKHDIVVKPAETRESASRPSPPR